MTRRKSALVRGAMLFVAMACAADLWADSSSTKQRTVVHLAEGIYEIRHPDAPDQFPQSNTTVVIGARDVLVVDSCYLPSAAREDIAQIKKWTSKPVRYLVNTHWHFDHTMGNRAYADAFPGISIIAQTETRRHIAGYNPGWFSRYPKLTVQLREQLATGKDERGNALTDLQKKQFTEILPGRDPVAAEFEALAPVDRPPDTSFDEELDLDLGNRPVQLKFLGRGNTSGDAVVYLPKDKILITGDLLDHPIPYLGGGFPFDQVKTLRRMAALEARIIIPGHGDVLRDKVFLTDLIEFLETVTEEVDRQVYLIGSGSRNLEKVRAAVEQNVDVARWRKRFAGTDKDDIEFFDSFSWPGLITAAHAQIAGR